MTLEQIRQLLGWCSLINMGLMLISYFIVSAARTWVYSIHSKFLPITESQFNSAIYSLYGLYKILIFMFNIVPWIALCIITS